jgi:hypothetical protein
MKKRKYKFYFIVERFNDWKENLKKVEIKKKPVLLISHTIIPDQALNYNDFWENIYKQNKNNYGKKI